jgi:hypothetical protein
MIGASSGGDTLPTASFCGTGDHPLPAFDPQELVDAFLSPDLLRHPYRYAKHENPGLSRDC